MPDLLQFGEKTKKRHLSFLRGRSYLTAVRRISIHPFIYFQWHFFQKVKVVKGLLEPTGGILTDHQS